MSKATSISLILSLYYVGLRDHRAGTGPLWIQAHGIEKALESFTPVSATTTAPVDDFEGDIGCSFEVLRRASAAVSFARANSAFAIVLSGNCHANVGVVTGLGVDKLSLVWLDAYTDMDTPDDHASGYFDAMGVSVPAGCSWRALTEILPGHRDRELAGCFTYYGLRAVTDHQRVTVEESRVDIVWGQPGKRIDFAAELGVMLDKNRRDRLWYTWTWMPWMSRWDVSINTHRLEGYSRTTC